LFRNLFAPSGVPRPEPVTFWGLCSFLSESSEFMWCITPAGALRDYRGEGNGVNSDFREWSPLTTACFLARGAPHHLCHWKYAARYLGLSRKVARVIHEASECIGSCDQDMRRQMLQSIAGDNLWVLVVPGESS